MALKRFRKEVSGSSNLSNIFNNIFNNIFYPWDIIMNKKLGFLGSSALSRDLSRLFSAQISSSQNETVTSHVT